MTTVSDHTSAGPRNGDVAFWFRETGFPQPRKALQGDRDVDVAVVGGGLTGLWTAYYLAREQPGLRVCIIEKEFAGFGASGRNGGWLSAELVGPPARYAAQGGRDGALALIRAMHEAVDEVIDVSRSEGIDADIVKSGRLVVARNAAQLERLHGMVDRAGEWGEPHKYQHLSTAELDERLHIHGARGALFAAQCARVQPAKLVLGVAEAVERLGVTIYEKTTARAITPGRVDTDRGTVRAPIVLRCLEGFTASMPGARREWLPMNSSMIVTAPLDDAQRAAVGWESAELLATSAHTYFYAQRTTDHRIAIGGRGKPYRFGSRTDRDGRTQARTVQRLQDLVGELFPAAGEITVEHAWCGVLGVPRDWCATVNFDVSSGLGTAGGYVGSGLTTTNLAGRTLADLVLHRDTDLTALPWTQRTVRRWEPEPFRWLGVHAMYGLYQVADLREQRTDAGRSSRIARFANALTGR